ncbi:MAG: AAC(3) family N-acetyltransferase [Phycisphaeraceae bacterium]
MPTLTSDDIRQGLMALGVRSSDVLMVHSSLKSFGNVDGGAEAVIDALLDAVGPTGTVAMPTLTKTYVGNTDSGLAFHRDRTPSRVGLITDTFWRRDEARRSGHPTHSVAAIGPHAGQLVRWHGPESHFGRHTPFGQLLQLDAKILFLGARIGTNTTLHAVEEWADLPTLVDARAQVEDDAGEVREVAVRAAPLGCRDFYKADSKCERLLRGAGVVHDGAIGPCRAIMLSSRMMERAMFRALFGDQPDIFCCDGPNCLFCTVKKAECWQRVAGRVPAAIQKAADAARVDSPRSSEAPVGQA